MKKVLLSCALLVLTGCTQPKQEPVVQPTPAAPAKDKNKEEARAYIVKGDEASANKEYPAARVYYQAALDLYPSDAIRAKVKRAAQLEASSDAALNADAGPSPDKVPPVDAYLSAADGYMKQRAQDVKLARARKEAAEALAREERKSRDVREAAKHVEEGRREEAARIGREIGRQDLHKDWNHR